jgi:transposase
MSQELNAAIAVIGIDIGKNSFHVVGHDHGGAIVLRQKWSRGQVEARLANLPRRVCARQAGTKTSARHEQRNSAKGGRSMT